MSDEQDPEPSWAIDGHIFDGLNANSPKGDLKMRAWDSIIQRHRVLATMLANPEGEMVTPSKTLRQQFSAYSLACITALQEKKTLNPTKVRSICSMLAKQEDHSLDPSELELMIELLSGMSGFGGIAAEIGSFGSKIER